MSEHNDSKKASTGPNPGRQAWITGGSSGFGLSVAEVFLKAGYNVTILGRNQQKLDLAHRYLSETLENQKVPGQKPNIDTISVDASDPKDVQKKLSAHYQTTPRLDVLVNCVGQSCRAAVDQADPELFQQMMQQNYFTTVNCTTACIPWLKQSSGSIVNIASLAGKTPWPNVAPYSAAKAAVASYTGSLRIELRGQVHVLLVCPGPIASDHQLDRYKSQAEGLDESANRPGAGAPLKSLDPIRLAERVLRAVETKKNEIIVPAKSRILFIASAISSRLGDWILRILGKK